MSSTDSTHESNAWRQDRRVTSAKCDQIRALLWDGASREDLEQRDDMPASGTITTHARGGCECKGREPPLSYDRDKGWEPCIGHELRDDQKSRVRITVEFDVDHGSGVGPDARVDFARRELADVLDNVRLVKGEVVA